MLAAPVAKPKTKPAASDSNRRLAPFSSRVSATTSARCECMPTATPRSRQIGALAYTVKSHVVFSGGQHAPESPLERRLLARELTHVIQQSPSVKRQPAALKDTAQALSPAPWPRRSSTRAIHTPGCGTRHPAPALLRVRGIVRIKAMRASRSPWRGSRTAAPIVEPGH